MNTSTTVAATTIGLSTLGVLAYYGYNSMKGGEGEGAFCRKFASQMPPICCTSQTGDDEVTKTAGGQKDSYAAVGKPRTIG